MSFSRNFSMLFDIFFLRFDLEWWGTIETNVRNISDLFIKWQLILHALRNLEPLMEWEALDYSLSSAFPVYYHDTVDSRALLVIRWIVCYQFWQSLLLCVKRTRAILLHTSECGTLWKDLNMKKDYEREARREREGQEGGLMPSYSAILPEYCVRRMSNFANICSLYILPLTVGLKNKIVLFEFSCQIHIQYHIDMIFNHSF